jgi:hypothetical protein
MTESTSSRPVAVDIDTLPRNRAVPLMLKPAAMEVFRDPTRYKVIGAGRRFGKTRLSLAWLIHGAMVQPGSLSYYVGPTYRASKTIAWTALKDLLPDSFVKSKHESELSVEFQNGSKIALKGADSADSLRGVSLDACVLDEAAFFKDLENAWQAVLRPALADKAGRAMFISTPNGLSNAFADIWELSLTEPDWRRWSFTTIDGGWVPQAEIEAARRTLSKELFEQEFLASFMNMMGCVYKSFSDANIEPDIEDMDGATLLLGCDFNVNPMTAVAAIRVADQLHIIDEFYMSNCNTYDLVSEVRLRYGNRAVKCFPDPTGRAKKTSAKGQETDHTILKRVGGFHVVVPSGVYAVKDKINGLNTLLKAADGTRRLFIHPRCKMLIRSLRGLQYKEGTQLPDQASDFSHLCDALGYLVLGEMNPLKRWKVGRGPAIPGWS